ncbi:MAG TPA: DUF503 domain-containing protein [Polyangiaceae bacterium]|nr:DUF503 domain-containing protein [Polyangiaceae bacterium]
MFVGVARLVLQIPGARSLKDRRRVVKSFKDRVRARLPVSVAEVGDVERHQVATIGLCVVSNDAARCSSALSAAARMARQVGDAVLADVATEITTFGHGGSGIRGGIEQALDSDDDFDDDDDWDES